VKKVMLFALLVVLLTPLAASGQATPTNVCVTNRGFGSRVDRDVYQLDLLCQPTLLNTLEVGRGDTITIQVNLANYYRATGRASAIFDIHLAMDRANIRLRQPDSLSSTAITDAGAALANVRIETTEREQYVFIIENLGLRSAVFDLSVRPEL
jgi:hypothetical protein